MTWMIKSFKNDMEALNLQENLPLAIGTGGRGSM